MDVLWQMWNKPGIQCTCIWTNHSNPSLKETDRSTGTDGWPSSMTLTLLNVNGASQATTHCGGREIMDNRWASKVTDATEPFKKDDTGSDTVRSETVSLSQWSWELIGWGEHCTKLRPVDTCTARLQHGMETMRLKGFLFFWSVYLCRRPILIFLLPILKKKHIHVVWRDESNKTATKACVIIMDIF